MAAPNPLFLREEELERGLELLHLAGHRLNLDASEPRAEAGVDETDHHALFLIDRQPGITQAELCGTLGLSKQTLSRHLRRLARAGLLEQPGGPQAGGSPADRRKRPLRVTPAAAALLAGVKAVQKRRLRFAFKNAGATAVEGFQRVLLELVGESPRERARRWTAGAAAAR